MSNKDDFFKYGRAKILGKGEATSEQRIGSADYARKQGYDLSQAHSADCYNIKINPDKIRQVETNKAVDNKVLDALKNGRDM